MAKFKVACFFLGHGVHILYLLNEKKRNSFCLAGKSARNPRFLLIITGWGESRAKQLCKLA